MPKQLSLFEAGEIPEEKEVIHELEVVVARMEDMQQEITNVQEFIVEPPQIGQQVKIQLPADKEGETYQYLRHYYPHLLNKVGEVTEIKLYPSGKHTCTVDFQGETLFLYPNHLILLY